MHNATDGRREGVRAPFLLPGVLLPPLSVSPPREQVFALQQAAMAKRYCDAPPPHVAGSSTPKNA